jgi:hypothetical protein
MIRNNQSVITPIGAGVAQGTYAITDASGQPIVKGALVRLQIDDTTRPQLNKSNCITPHAKLSGLWVFQESELK